jgi:hypothetical protein
MELSINDVTQFKTTFNPLHYNRVFYYLGLTTVVTKSLTPLDCDVIYGRP